MNTNTPRTDSQDSFCSEDKSHPDEMVDINFARELERELNTANARIATLQIELDDALMYKRKLEADRIDLWKEVSAAKHTDLGYAALCEHHEKALAAKDAQIEVLKEALKPFAEGYNGFMTWYTHVAAKNALSTSSSH